jgi:hypothetical protein
MRGPTLVTDADLAQARLDPHFRQELLAEHLERLLAALSVLRKSGKAGDPRNAEQIREGVELAMKLSNLLHTLAKTGMGAAEAA